MLLVPLNKISITLFMDNITDSPLPNSPHAHRPPLGKDEKFLPAPIAVHGFSALVKPEVNNKNSESGPIQRNTYLFDAGTSEYGVTFNSDQFGIDLQSIDAILPSHGHFEHSSE